MLACARHYPRHGAAGPGPEGEGCPYLVDFPVGNVQIVLIYFAAASLGKSPLTLEQERSPCWVSYFPNTHAQQYK